MKERQEGSGLRNCSYTKRAEQSQGMSSGTATPLCCKTVSPSPATAHSLGVSGAGDWSPWQLRCGHPALECEHGWLCASGPPSHSGHKHQDRQLLIGRENCIWWVWFSALVLRDFSVWRERARAAQRLVCSSGSVIWTLQSCLISSYLQICLSFVCMPVHAWGSEFLPLDLQLIQDRAVQGEGQSHFSWHAALCLCSCWWPWLAKAGPQDMW